jgi:hypothetical protein
MNSSLDYIWEKYEAIIGFDPIVHDDESEDWFQSVVLKPSSKSDNFSSNLNSLKLKIIWFEKWMPEIILIGRLHTSRLIEPKKERVINYICRLIDDQMKSPSEIFSLFEECIGKIDNVNSSEYRHIHPNLMKALSSYREHYRRELNLELLTLEKLK